MANSRRSSGAFGFGVDIIVTMTFHPSPFRFNIQMCIHAMKTTQLALLAFLALLGISSVTILKPKPESTSKSAAADPSTPQRKTRSATTETGSIITPAGRRSARLRAKHD